MSKSDEVKLADNWLEDALDDATIDIAHWAPGIVRATPCLQPYRKVPQRLRQRLRESYKARFKWHTGEEL